ncbi:MAG TPA: ATP-binding protein [Candidatus Obscuribacterales bacterium]
MTVGVKDGSEELSALNALIQDLGARWSRECRDIKFDLEFKAIEQERRRVAKEIHDEILPSLARLIRSVQGSADGKVDHLIEELHETVGAIRDLLGELHPVDLEELGIVPALGNLCKRYARLTGRCIFFIEEDEECHLSDLRQLCLYRALQTALKLFAATDNDILLLTYARCTTGSILTLRCVDKRVSSARWLSNESDDFDIFESWCAMAGAEVHLGENADSDYPYDLIITLADEQAPQEDITSLIDDLSLERIKELNSIITTAQEEWVELINRDCALFRKLAVEMERAKISHDINRITLPHLNRISKSLDQTMDRRMRRDVRKRMDLIMAGINAVISELHPRLLKEVGLLDAVKTVVDRFKRATLIETTIISEVPSQYINEIDNKAKFALYRVVQEALNNIEKHSGANRALVSVREVDNSLIVQIEDNGRGFQAAAGTLSFGLKNIRERAKEVNAEVSWCRSSSFDNGTQVTITLPFAKQSVEVQQLASMPAGQT